MSDTSDYVLTSGPSGRVDVDTAINKPISTPATSNEGLKIIGYPVSFQEIESLKKQYQAAAGDRTDAREAILQAILDDYANQFASLKGIFIKNTACEKCGSCALVRGSRHEIFQNVRTHKIWADLLYTFNDIHTKANPMDLASEHLFFLKKRFEELEFAYRADNIAEECTGPWFQARSDAEDGPDV